MLICRMYSFKRVNLYYSVSIPLEKPFKNWIFTIDWPPSSIKLKTLQLNKPQNDLLLPRFKVKISYCFSVNGFFKKSYNIMEVIDFRTRYSKNKQDNSRNEVCTLWYNTSHQSIIYTSKKKSVSHWIISRKIYVKGLNCYCNINSIELARCIRLIRKWVEGYFDLYEAIFRRLKSILMCKNNVNKSVVADKRKW